MLSIVSIFLCKFFISSVASDDDISRSGQKRSDRTDGVGPLGWVAFEVLLLVRTTTSWLVMKVWTTL